MIREFKEVPFIIAHFGVQTGGVYSFEAFWMVMDSPNVYVESGWCLQSRLVDSRADVEGSDDARHGFAAE